MSPKKRKAPRPQVRHTWKINPKTRVKPSKKIYRRSRRKGPPTWVDQVDWFGESA